ncbi:hypothetical protein [Bacillus sp. 3255]|uniref:hypothetical protein n=1 Tax=Bacillus sp. 3255 TaxID=2817904 RepID=UPI002858D69A|nr:hypothetical protein [Bacillus sp. 3255]MDR6879592.1 hypothetical protein [Bacillus sp. 3255]
MDEQKETVRSVDPKTGKSTEVNVILDHVRSGGMAYTAEEVESKHSDSQKDKK